MTPEQASKLRKGDRILVEMVVVDVDTKDLDQPVHAAAVGSEYGVFWPNPEYIHASLPRPLEAGDRVTADGSTLDGTIIAVADREAWVRWPAGDTTVEPLSDLQRVEDQ